MTTQLYVEFLRITFSTQILSAQSHCFLIPRTVAIFGAILLFDTLQILVMRPRLRLLFPSPFSTCGKYFFCL